MSKLQNWFVAVQYMSLRPTVPVVRGNPAVVLECARLPRSSSLSTETSTSLFESVHSVLPVRIAVLHHFVGCAPVKEVRNPVAGLICLALPDREPRELWYGLSTTGLRRSCIGTAISLVLGLSVHTSGD